MGIARSLRLPACLAIAVLLFCPDFAGAKSPRQAGQIRIIPASPEANALLQPAILSGLQNGVPWSMTLESMNYGNVYIEVPEGATKLTVVTSGGVGDLDLYLKYGSTVSGGTVPELDEDADIRSDGPTAVEQIEITPETNPPLVKGNWYIAVLNLNDYTTQFSVTATYETPEPEEAEALPQLSFRINDAHATPWSSVRIAADASGAEAEDRFDLYVALRDAGTGALTFLSESPPADGWIFPFRSNFAFTDEVVLLEGILGAELPQMTFYLFGVLVKPGASPLDPSNWASDLAALVIILGNLSQVQWDVLSDYGTPHAFHILFDRETHRRIETWSYGSNRMFQFINGQGLVAPEPGARGGVSGGRGVPVSYGPGFFHPSTTTEDLRALLGEPDRILDGETPGERTWYFCGAGIFATFVNDVVTEIGGE